MKRKTPTKDTIIQTRIPHKLKFKWMRKLGYKTISRRLRELVEGDVK